MAKIVAVYTMYVYDDGKIELKEHSCNEII
jgi:hypothetical protein